MNNNSSMREVNFSNKTGFYQKKKGIFENPILVSLILFIGMTFIAYAFYIYYYNSADNNVKTNREA